VFDGRERANRPGIVACARADRVIATGCNDVEATCCQERKMEFLVTMTTQVPLRAGHEAHS